MLLADYMGTYISIKTPSAEGAGKKFGFRTEICHKRNGFQKFGKRGSDVGLMVCRGAPDSKTSGWIPKTFGIHRGRNLLIPSLSQLHAYISHSWVSAGYVVRPFWRLDTRDFFVFLHSRSNDDDYHCLLQAAA